MKEASKPTQISTIASDLRALLFSLLRTRRTKVFLYGIAFGCVAFTAYLAFCLPEKASPWFNNLPYRSQISSLFSYIFHNSSSSPSPEKAATLPGNQMTGGEGTRKAGVLVKNRTRSGTGTSASGVSGKNEKEEVVGSRENGVSATKNEMVEGARVNKGGIFEARNRKGRGIGSRGIDVTETNRADSGTGLQGGGDSTKNHMVKEGNGISTNDKGRDGVGSEKHSVLAVKNQARRGVPSKNETTTSEDGPAETGGNLPSSAKNQTRRRVTPKGNQVPTRYKESTANPQKNEVAAKNRPSSGDASIPKSARTPTPEVDRKRVPHAFGGDRRKKMNWTSAMEGCDIFQGRWVKDDSYPLYPEGSCPHIDEPFDCYHNGRPDRAYQKLRWQPNGCNIPRLNATDMLERLRGRRLVFVGDSLNRNMWESLVCVLRNSVRDKRKVFEASGRHEFRTDGSYSFVFEDFNCSVEFFRTPFLVQEWEMPIRKGRTKETLRLDIVERSSSMYKDAYVIIFNTGHWWTHEKTAKGKDYYQEGRHIYSELNVEEAFHKALRTWAKWVDTNVNPMKSLVFFRGYSASHFSGGQWNSGGQCDKETSPIENDEYLSPYPSLMTALESVIKGMKTPVSYLNITRMSDYRKDAHPSIYRKQDLTEEERRDPERFQDCSHWCLPGVPDSWNEILYAQLIIKQHQLLLHAENKSNM